MVSYTLLQFSSLLIPLQFIIFFFPKSLQKYKQEEHLATCILILLGLLPNNSLSGTGRVVWRKSEFILIYCEKHKYLKI